MSEPNWLPQSPADLAGSPSTLVDFLASYHDLLLVLIGARAADSGIPPEVLARHAVAALATAQAIEDDLRSERAAIVRDALGYGATVDELRTALGGTLDGALGAIVNHTWVSRSSG